MSNLLSTSAMVAECQSRVPIGLDSTFWMKKLNEAYRWITQKGNFIWELQTAAFTLNPSFTTWTLPSDCNVGKPMYVSGPYDSVITAPLLPSLIPYVPWDVAFAQQTSEMDMPAGAFSVWTYLATFAAGPPPVYAYQGLLYPQSAAPTAGTGAMSYSFIYHVDVANTEKAAAANQFFPTPNCFDNLLIELAEAEARRIYGIAGWDIVQKRAESAIVSLLDPYRSTKNAIAGMVDQQKQTGERKLMGQENS